MPLHGRASSQAHVPKPAGYKTLTKAAAKVLRRRAELEGSSSMTSRPITTTCEARRLNLAALQHSCKVFASGLGRNTALRRQRRTCSACTSVPGPGSLLWFLQPATACS
jgi:hypothetical protein